MLLAYLILGLLITILFVLNWRLAWRKNETDTHMGLETWKGWDDGHGGGLA